MDCYHDAMRTTVTLDPHVQALLKKAMRSGDLSFKQALNDGLRAGLAPRAPAARAAPWVPPMVDMGAALADLSKTGALLDELETQELLAKLQRLA